MPTTRGRPRSVELNERAFHRWARTHLPAGRAGLLPLGDDAAALSVGRHRVVLLSSDALIEGVHFARGSPPLRIGEAAAAVNLSDIAAKGGVPAALLMDLLAPPGTPEVWARSVLRGAERMAAQFGCHVVGGDTKPSPTRAVVGCSVGWAGKESLPTRGGAQAGDQVVTTGVVGYGGAFRSDITAALRVRPRIPEGRVLGPVAHSMTDTSDGIADAAHLLAEASRRRIVLVAEQLPLHPRLRRSIRSVPGRLRAAFYGGDYELLATMTAGRVASVRAALRRLGCPLTLVGRVEHGSGAWLERDGIIRPLPGAGWRHFDRR
ncbi:MAG: thiamine-phosphate kinase [Thermoplasmata archaeon]|nr:thiamine-phosphate kinase [Thermoplasmata archaeon]